MRCVKKSFSKGGGPGLALGGAKADQQPASPFTGVYRPLVKQSKSLLIPTQPLVWSESDQCLVPCPFGVDQRLFEVFDGCGLGPVVGQLRTSSISLTLSL